MAINYSIMISIASVIQIAFLVAIVIEVIRLLGSFGKSKDGKAVSDAAVGAAKGIWDFGKKKIETAKADAEKREKELEDENARKEELGRYLGTLAIDEREKLIQIEKGIGILKNILDAEPQRLNDPTVLDHLKSHVIEPMSVSFTKIRDDMGKELSIYRRFKAENKAKKTIADMVKDYKDIHSSINTLQVKLHERLNKYRTTVPPATPAEISFVENQIKAVESVLARIDIIKFNNLSADVGGKEQEQGENYDKLSRLIRGDGGVSVANKFKTDMTKLLDSVNNLKANLTGDPLKRGKARTDFENAIKSLSEHLDKLKSNYAGIIQLVTRINEAVPGLTEGTRLVHNMLNSLERDMSDLESKIIHGRSKGYT